MQQICFMNSWIFRDGWIVVSCLNFALLQNWYEMPQKQSCFSCDMLSSPIHTSLFQPLTLYKKKQKKKYGCKREWKEKAETQKWLEKGKQASTCNIKNS